MSVVAEFRLSHPSFPTIEAVRSADGMRLRAEQVLADEPRKPVVFFWAEGGDFDEFEAGLNDDPGVTDWTCIETLDDRRLYRVDVCGESGVILYPTDLEVGASRLDFSADADGVEVRTRFVDREAMRRYFDRCREQGMDVSLQRLYGSERSESAFPDVSEKQREALRVAAECGYFHVPRQADLGDLAEILGVSRQAASERLRRGTDALVREAFDVDPYGDGDTKGR